MRPSEMTVQGEGSDWTFYIDKTRLIISRDTIDPDKFERIELDNLETSQLAGMLLKHAYVKKPKEWK
jgi:hypothetical protein